MDKIPMITTSYKLPKCVCKVEDLPEGDVLVALVNETYRTDDGDHGYDSSPMVQIILLGNREQALAWVTAQEESAFRFGSRKMYKIASIKTLPVQRTVSLAFE